MFVLGVIAQELIVVCLLQKVHNYQMQYIHLTVEVWKFNNLFYKCKLV